MASPQALAAAHLSGDAQARSWLGEPWTGIRRCAESARSLTGTWDRIALAAIAASCGAQRHTCDLLRNPANVVVVTGQQPAAGGGPLYTLVKIAHALALARRLRDEDVPAVAWFWCASEDHDLGEANHADLLRRDGSIQRITADLGSGRQALRHRPASCWWAEVRAACLADGLGLGGRWLDEHAPLADEGMGAWLCRLLGDLFAGEPFVACEGHRLRPLWLRQLGLALDQWPAEALATRRADLLRAGQGDALGELRTPPLFADTPAARTALEPEAARRLLAGDPLALSPGAALRPVLQQAALPASVAILGVGEMAYHAAIGPAYPALHTTAPMLVPRCSLTLVPSWVERAAQRQGLSCDSLADGAPPVRPAGRPPSERLAALSHAIEGLGGPATEPQVAAAQVRLRRELGRLEASLVRSERVAAGLTAPGALAAFLRPRGQRQERVQSLFQALWQHGPGLGGELVHAAGSASPGEHHLVRLAG